MDIICIEVFFECGGYHLEFMLDLLGAEIINGWFAQTSLVAWKGQISVIASLLSGLESLLLLAAQKDHVNVSVSLLTGWEATGSRVVSLLTAQKAF